jgi:hypothetical protein
MESYVKITGTVKWSKQHKGEKGGVNVYFIEVPETRKNKDGEDYEKMHSFMAKNFFMNTDKKSTKLYDVGLVATFEGVLKTESWKPEGSDDWNSNTIIELTKVTL